MRVLCVWWIQSCGRCLYVEVLGEVWGISIRTPTDGGDFDIEEGANVSDSEDRIKVDVTILGRESIWKLLVILAAELILVV